MLKQMARESGVETPPTGDLARLARLDRKRAGRTLSNWDRVSGSDPGAGIVRMKDDATHLAYKPEHAVDLDTGSVVAAEPHPADEGDMTTLSRTLAVAGADLEAVDAAPTAEDPAECVADRGCHSRAILKGLDDSPWRRLRAQPARGPAAGAESAGPGAAYDTAEAFIAEGRPRAAAVLGCADIHGLCRHMIQMASRLRQRLPPDMAARQA